MSKFQIKLRSIEYQHLNKCANLFVSVFNKSPWNETWNKQVAFNRLEDCYNTPGFYGVIAFENSKVLGFAIGYIEKWCDHNHFYLKEMCIESSNQRQGIGTKIVDALNQNLIVRDVTMVYLLTIRDSIAEAFYNKCGFSLNSKMILMSKIIKSYDL